jgi:hypothetical protein
MIGQSDREQQYSLLRSLADAHTYTRLCNGMFSSISSRRDGEGRQGIFDLNRDINPKEETLRIVDKYT